jgi:hypothetical protein
VATAVDRSRLASSLSAAGLGNHFETKTSERATHRYSTSNRVGWQSKQDQMSSREAKSSPGIVVNKGVSSSSITAFQWQHKRFHNESLGEVAKSAASVSSANSAMDEEAEIQAAQAQRALSKRSAENQRPGEDVHAGTKFEGELTAALQAP